MKHNNFDFSQVHEGQIFKNFTELYKALTGKKPPEGKGNQVAVKNQLSRYMDFGKLCEIDPSIKSTRMYVIKKIYDTPLETEERRGRRGIYADRLRPLLLSQKHFSGKMTQLINRLGIFREYADYKLIGLDAWKNNNDEYNPWQIQKEMTPGLKQYNLAMHNLIRATVERCLDSLQNEKILEWNYYYQLIPDVLTDIELSKLKRPKTKNELKADKKKRDGFLADILADSNCVLLPDTVGKP